VASRFEQYVSCTLLLHTVSFASHPCSPGCNGRSPCQLAHHGHNSYPAELPAQSGGLFVIGHTGHIDYDEVCVVCLYIISCGLRCANLTRDSCACDVRHSWHVCGTAFFVCLLTVNTLAPATFLLFRTHFISKHCLKHCCWVFSVQVPGDLMSLIFV